MAGLAGHLQFLRRVTTHSFARLHTGRIEAFPHQMSEQIALPTSEVENFRRLIAARFQDVAKQNLVAVTQSARNLRRNQFWKRFIEEASGLFGIKAMYHRNSARDC